MKTLLLFLLAAMPAWGSLTGKASWETFTDSNQIMANGKPFNPSAFTCATRRYPLGTCLRVTDVKNGLSVTVTVTDRNSIRSDTNNIIADLSPEAFMQIDPLTLGIADVRLDEIK